MRTQHNEAGYVWSSDDGRIFAAISRWGGGLWASSLDCTCGVTNDEIDAAFRELKADIAVINPADAEAISESERMAAEREAAEAKRRRTWRYRAGRTIRRIRQRLGLLVGGGDVQEYGVLGGER